MSFRHRSYSGNFVSHQPLAPDAPPRNLSYILNRDAGDAGRYALDSDKGIIEDAMDIDLIQTDPNVMMGKPVIAGTRITVELILEKLAAGETVDEILEAHPRLTRESVVAALKYAVRSLNNPPPKKAA